MIPLYALPVAFEAIETEIDQADGELSADLETRLDALETNLEEKTEAIAILIRRAESEEAVYQAEVDRLTMARNVARNRKDRLKLYLLTTLQTLGRDHVATRLFKVRIQKNSAPSVRWVGEGLFPTQYQRVKIELDATAVLRDWRAGVALPDDLVVAVGHHLRIT